MLKLQIFDKYKEFIHYLLDLKEYKKEIENHDFIDKILKFDLKSQLFLIRDTSIKEDLLKKSKNSTQYYEFDWKIKKSLNNDIYELSLKIKSHFRSYQIKNFYIIISKKSRFILVIGYFSSKNLERIGAFFESFLTRRFQEV